MRGILRPCRHRLGPELHARWLSHLCGLCLTLRDTAGQSARVLTGYDVLLVPVLIEAQTGRLPTGQAGPCPLRGFRKAEVVDSETPAMQAGAAAALVAGGAGLTDKVADGDVPVWLGPVASRSADRLDRLGGNIAAGCGMDVADLASAPLRAKAVEAQSGAGLEQVLAPAGTAVASLFAHTAGAAGVPGNTSALRAAGDAFGRIVHLADATKDRRSDERHGRFNPLGATGTGDSEAAEMARSLHAEILGSLGQLDLVDDGLAAVLLGPTLSAARRRIWAPSVTARATSRGNGAGLAFGLAGALMTQRAMWGGRRRGGRRNDPYDPYRDDRYDPRYGGGYRRRRGCGGAGCGEMLACNCCANCVCNECCGGDDCCCCCI